MKNKNTYLILFIILLILPMSVSANIICNDGTISPSCQDCHRGCCSRHGGCSNSLASDNSNYNSYIDEGNSSNNNVKVSEEDLLEKNENKNESYIDEIIDEDYSSDNNFVFNGDTDDTQDDDGNFLGGLAIISIVGYLVYKKKKKQ